MKLRVVQAVILFGLVISCSDDINTKTSNAILEDAYQEIRHQTSKPNSKKVNKTNAKKVYAHYMPWFYNLDQDGYWGQHWTMTNKDPNIVDASGKREIASHYYPLIGPYSSNDDDLQEYHLLLMKLSGIDGVIFDWYGCRNVYDYNNLMSSTESFITEIEDVGLEFAIMYEDKVAEKNAITKRVDSTSINNAVLDLKYIQNTYFTSNNYIKINNSELLFIFGPNYITSPLDWKLINSQLNNTPHIMSLWAASDRLGQFSGGEFSWVDSNHMVTLSNYYETAFHNNIETIGGVYPGFNDYYFEGGWRPNTDNDWIIPSKGVHVLDETLNLTDSYPVEFIQLITWNDFGEGTMLEPTREFGFSFLEKIQDYTGVSCSADDLRLPYRLYNLRKKHPNDIRIQSILDRIYQYIFTLDFINAEILLATLEGNYSL